MTNCISHFTRTDIERNHVSKEVECSLGDTKEARALGDTKEARALLLDEKVIVFHRGLCACSYKKCGRTGNSVYL